MEHSHQLNCLDSTLIMATGQYVWLCDSVKYSCVQPFEDTDNSLAYFGCYTQHTQNFGVWLHLVLLSVHDVM
jgi:hypothetical protein